MQLTLVDAFASRPFTGNQAAVAVLDRWPDDTTMQQVAAELGWAETAFTVPRPDGDWDLRWFTPAVEVDLCGHATLATAHVLGGTARFHTRSGVLDCRPEAADGGGRPEAADRGGPPNAATASATATATATATTSATTSGDAGGDWIAMALPADPPAEAPRPDGIDLPGLQWFGRGRFDAVAVLADAATVRAYRPDLDAVAALGARGLVITAPGDRPGVDCVSRVFGPNAGIPEDPVTGSAHCILAELWGERLGRLTLLGEQASARGGMVRMRRDGPHVVVSGQAVIVGKILLLETAAR